MESRVLPKESSALLTVTHKGFHGKTYKGKTFPDLVVQSVSHIRFFSASYHILILRCYLFILLPLCWKSSNWLQVALHTQ